MHHPFARVLIVQFACLVMSILIPSSGMGQSYSLYHFAPELCDSLMDIQKRNGDVKLYCQLFKRLRSQIKKEKDKSLFEDAGYFLEWDNLMRDSILARKQYCYYGYDIRKSFGDIEQSLNYYLKAHQLGGDLKNVDDFWYVENILGFLYNIKGDHQLSEYYYQKTLTGLANLSQNTLDDDKQKKYSAQLVRTRNNLGYLYNWMTDYKRASDILSTNLEEAERTHNYLGITSACNFLTTSYLELGQFKKARNVLSQAASNIPELPNSRQPEARINFHSLSGQLYLKENKPQDALFAFESELQIRNEQREMNSRFLGKCLNNLSKCYLAIGDPDKAMEIIKQGFNVFNLRIDKIWSQMDSIIPENTIAELSETQSLLYYENYKTTENPLYLDSALWSLNLSIAIFDKLRNDYVHEHSQLISISDNKRLLRNKIDLLWEKHLIRPLEDLDELKKTFLKSKNLILQTIKDERAQLNSLGPEDKSRAITIQDKITNLSFRLNSSNDPNSEKTKEKIIELTLELQKFITSRESSWNDPDDPYINYFVGKDHIYALDNLNDKIQFKRLGTKVRLRSLIEKSNEGIRNKDDSTSFYQNQKDLFAYLLGNTSTLPSKFIIYPDDFIYYLSFSALVIPEQEKFLIEEAETYIGYTLDNSFSKELKNNIAVISPDYPRVNIDSQMTRGSIYHLPYAAEEITSINRHFEEQLEVYHNISQNTFKSILEKSSHLHFAGHAVIENNVAYLALDSLTHNWISMEQISKLNKGPSSVILSACETGLGQIANGEGVRSLARSFLISGTQSILYSLWAINDYTSSKIIDHLYDHLSKGRDLSTALHLAQRKYLVNASQTYRHPYYWAAFVAVDPKTKDSTFDGAYQNTILLFLFLFLFVLILGIFKLKK